MQGALAAYRRAALVLVAAVYVASAAAASEAPDCRFAVGVTTQQLLTSESAREKFIHAVAYWEGHFHTVGVSYNNGTGMAYDGHGINYTSGMPAPPLHYWSAPSKESLHVMMLALALKGNPHAQTFVNYASPEQASDVALTLLEKKMTSVERFNQQFPGYGGYLPWVYINDTGMIPADGWSNAVPALDNGEFIWALYGARVVLDQRFENRSRALSERIARQLQLMAANAQMIFYNNDGYIRSVATIADNQAPPTPANYGLQCGDPDPTAINSTCFLDDPYEGEMFAVFLDLYSKWTNETERDQIWVNKRAKLQAVDFHSSKGVITAQRGWWFSAHEQWKYLELPYLYVPINRRVFMNGERVRTLNSVMNKVPGLYASVNDVAPAGQQPPDYVSDAGIPAVAFNQVFDTAVITPYGSFPVILASQAVGLAWYNTMLNGPRMQGPLGSTEAVNVTGTAISQVVTWDSKISTLIAICGGIYDEVALGLQLDGKYDRFYSVIEREWLRAFPKLEGETIDFETPNAEIPNAIGDFVTCTSS